MPQSPLERSQWLVKQLHMWWQELWLGLAILPCSRDAWRTQPICRDSSNPQWPTPVSNMQHPMGFTAFHCSTTSGRSCTQTEQLVEDILQFAIGSITGVQLNYWEAKQHRNLSVAVKQDTNAEMTKNWHVLI